MNDEEILEKLLEEGYSKEEALSILQELKEEEEHENWFFYHEFIER